MRKASLGCLFLVFAATVYINAAAAAANDQVNVTLNTTSAAPREVEETTAKAITREYGTAWKTLATALRENRKDTLPASFVGPSLDALNQQIEQQRKTGLSVRYLDRGHKLDVIFYSPEGSALQLRDTATLEKQYLESGGVRHSESFTQKYIVLMTVAEDRWKVRVLQEEN